MGEYQIAGSYSPIEQSDSLDEAIGKLEKLAVDSSVWNGIGGKPDVFIPDVDSSSLATYSKDASTGDINTSDSLVTALAKLENKAEAGADERIPNDVIDSIINNTYTPTA
jgi:hypothetical protein